MATNRTENIGPRREKRGHQEGELGVTARNGLAHLGTDRWAEIRWEIEAGAATEGAV